MNSIAINSLNMSCNQSSFRVDVQCIEGAVAIADNRATPYQGTKRGFGEYKCIACGKEWKSANSRANETQACTRCFMQVFPQKQKSLQSLYEVLRRDKACKHAIIEEQIAMQNAARCMPVDKSA